MKLRPHHLFCTQTFQGAGYNQKFIDQMTKIVDILQTTNCEIELVLEEDDICQNCPVLHNNVCSSSKKIMVMDQKVVDYFNLQCKKYNYQILINKINDKLTKDIFIDICSDCEWYKQGFCRELFDK